jgi:hypothetical protein
MAELELHAVHVVPVWQEGGQPHVCVPGEIRKDPVPTVLGWANVLDMSILGHRRMFLAVDP